MYASPGPLATAISIAQNTKQVIKQKPGININGLKVPNTAAANSKPKPSAAAKPAKATSAAKAGGTERKSARKSSQ